MDHFEELESETYRAAAASGFVRRFIDAGLWRAWWPRWRKANAERRLDNQLQPRDDTNPLQVRTLVAMLLDDECPDVWDVLEEIRREGRARALARRLEELEQERRRPRRVEPRLSKADVA